MALVLCCLALCVGGVFSQANAPDLATALSNDGHFTIILDLLNKTGLLQQLMNEKNITCFLPSDLQLDDKQHWTWVVEHELKPDPQHMKEVLQYHCVSGSALKIKDLKNDMVLDSMLHKPFRINVYPKMQKISAQGLAVLQRNIHIANGYVHQIDGIMRWPTQDIMSLIESNGRLSTTLRLLRKAGLIQTITDDQSITVFAPYDGAWAALKPAVMDYLENHVDALKEVLLYHMITSTTIFDVGFLHSTTYHTANKQHDNVMFTEDFNGYSFINRVRLGIEYEATNGILYSAQGVLLPPQIVLELEGNGVQIGNIDIGR